jgi:hypothetical protein
MIPIWILAVLIPLTTTVSIAAWSRWTQRIHRGEHSFHDEAVSVAALINRDPDLRAGRRSASSTPHPAWPPIDQDDTERASDPATEVFTTEFHRLAS